MNTLSTTRAAFRLLFCICLMIFFLLLNTKQGIAQCSSPLTANCQAVPSSELIQAGNGSLTFTFDDFTSYTAGLTQSGMTTLRLKVLPNNASCKWALRMYVENNPASGTPVNEMETIQSYGSGGNAPTLDLIEVKVYNGCGTPINNGVYQNFAAVNGAFIDIINDATLNIAGSCTENVNGPGSYLTNYSEYTFNIDYRITPGLVYGAGVYQLILHFCLVEQP